MKAAFLLNFAKFVGWPADVFTASDSPIAICILGKDPFGRVIDDTVQGEGVNSRKFVVKRISDPAEMKNCQVAFLGSSTKDVSRLLGGLDHGVLTVGDTPQFTRDGGIIGFVVDNRHVRFDINEAAADRAGLKLSSKLLSVARTVER